MRKKILQFILIFIIGGLGGVLADHFLIPYLASLKAFSNVGFLQKSINGTTIINPTERVIVRENRAVEEAIDKNLNKVVAVESYDGEKIITEGTGFILTSDGLVLTSNDLIPERADTYSVVYQGETIKAKPEKRDTENNLALFSINKENLPIVSFGEDNLKLGERIISIGSETSENFENNYFVNSGIIRSKNENGFLTDIKEANLRANGAPVINIKGEVVGLGLISQKGQVSLVEVGKIRQILES